MLCFGSIMGQRIAKRHSERGVSLYNQQNYAEALLELEDACKKLTKEEDIFRNLNYLCLVYMELGRYHDVLLCAKRQVVVSGQMQNDALQAEATFNMARAYERLGEYRTSVSLCTRSLVCKNLVDMTPLSGYAHLCLANSYYGLSEIRRSLKHYDKSAHVSRILCDTVLELRVFMGLGQLFMTLQDNATALQHYVRASEIARQFSANHPCVKYQRRVAVEMAVVYAKLGRLGEALEICEEAMKQALTHGDRLVQARCLLNFAEIHREKQNYQRAYPRYQSAYAISMETGDRKCQLDVLSGMALCVFGSQDMEQAVELNEKVLKLSQEIDSKLDMLESHRRLCDIYMYLESSEFSQLHGFHVRQLLNELQLYCGVCTEIIGAKDEKLRPLPCYHIIHERCLVHLYRPTSSSTLSLQRRRPCPTCRHRTSSNPISDEEF
ncbi:43 kDa receptor-associated protein of the synapse-like [Ruditapes philippinarum]|uniref:43 kDa receptor-associated protein of the synapse-like n=1 Tax=Ruditapes philippinarum TaxID=129788 RepID=UPI00295B7E6E|nr:43 kDa receptor-associated protein of the synapse-like [Ruditapes philippinarum]